MSTPPDFTPQQLRNALHILEHNGGTKIGWIMPDAKDEYFSARLYNRIFYLAKSLDISDLEIAIREQYHDESAPGHYHSIVRYGNPNSLICRLSLAMNYRAELQGVVDRGTMHLEVATNSPRKATEILLNASFAFYDEAIRRYYPEYTTTYLP